MIDKPEIVVGTLLLEAGETLSVAESCTGGLLGHLLTEVPGSSRYFVGGVIAYADSIKVALLLVPTDLVREFGAVSRECALAMARGVKEATGASIGLSVTGIAGPDGGTPAKPVGTVYVGLVANGFEEVSHFAWTGDRSENKRHSAEAAFNMIISYLSNRAGARAANGAAHQSESIINRV